MIIVMPKTSKAIGPNSNSSSLNRLEESLVVMNFFHERMRTVLDSISGRESDKNLMSATYEHILIIVDAFLKEWGTYCSLKKMYPKVAYSLECLKPALIPFGRWSEIYLARNILFAHRSRDHGNLVLPGSIYQGKIPTSIKETIFLGRLIIFITERIVSHNREEFDSALNKVKSIWPPTVKTKSRTRQEIDKEFETIKIEVSRIEKRLGPGIS